MSPAKTDVLSLLTAFPWPSRQLWWLFPFAAGESSPAFPPAPNPFLCGPPCALARVARGRQEAYPGCPSPPHRTAEKASTLVKNIKGGRRDGVPSRLARHTLTAQTQGRKEMAPRLH